MCNERERRNSVEIDRTTAQDFHQRLQSLAQLLSRHQPENDCGHTPANVSVRAQVATRLAEDFGRACLK